MNTEEIMSLAVELSGFDEVPPDSEIFVGGENVQRVLFGIDIYPEDVLRAKEEGFDLVISHHSPCMTSGEGFLKVLGRHGELMVSGGVDEVTARKVVDEVRRMWLGCPYIDPTNHHEEITNYARSLDMPLMNIHLTCDEMGRRVLQGTADSLDPAKPVSDLIEFYRAIPEIRASGEEIRLISGDEDRPVGKIVAAHGAGGNGGYYVANALFDAGAGTVVYITFFPFQEAEGNRLREENKGTLVVTPHYASDSIGINPLISELEKRGLQVKCCNNLIRC